MDILHLKELGFIKFISQLTEEKVAGIYLKCERHFMYLNFFKIF